MHLETLSILIFVGCIFVHSVNSQSFAQQCLDAHNTYRARHGAAPLTLDNNLTNYAQQWANHLININRMQHRSNNKYGENIYASWGATSLTGSTPVKSWYDEIKDYNFSNPGFHAKTGHFTQVVWKGSQRLGCAVARKGNNFYVVANYDPPGNYRGQFEQNVLRGR